MADFLPVLYKLVPHNLLFTGLLVAAILIWLLRKVTPIVIVFLALFNDKVNARLVKIIRALKK